MHSGAAFVLPRGYTVSFPRGIRRDGDAASSVVTLDPQPDISGKWITLQQRLLPTARAGDCCQSIIYRSLPSFITTSMDPDFAARTLHSVFSLMLPESTDPGVGVTAVQLGNMLNMLTMYQHTPKDLATMLTRRLRQVNPCDFCLQELSPLETIKRLSSSGFELALYHKTVRLYGHKRENHPDGPDHFPYPNAPNLTEFGIAAELWTAVVGKGDWAQYGIRNPHDVNTMTAAQISAAISDVCGDFGLLGQYGFYFHRAQIPAHFHFHLFKGDMVVAGIGKVPVLFCALMADLYDVIFRRSTIHDPDGPELWSSKRYPDVPDFTCPTHMDQMSRKLHHLILWIQGTYAVPNFVLHYFAEAGSNAEGAAARFYDQMKALTLPTPCDGRFYVVKQVHDMMVKARFDYPHHIIALELSTTCSSAVHTYEHASAVYELLRSSMANEELNLTYLMRPKGDKAVIKFNEMKAHFSLSPKRILMIGEAPGKAAVSWLRDRSIQQLTIIAPGNFFLPELRRDTRVTVHNSKIQSFETGTAADFDLVTSDALWEMSYWQGPIKAFDLEYHSMRVAADLLIIGGTYVMKVMSGRLPYIWVMIEALRPFFKLVTGYKSETTAGNEELYMIFEGLKERFEIATKATFMEVGGEIGPEFSLVAKSIMYRAITLVDIIANPHLYSTVHRDHTVIVARSTKPRGPKADSNRNTALAQLHITPGGEVIRTTLPVTTLVPYSDSDDEYSRTKSHSPVPLPRPMSAPLPSKDLKHSIWLSACSTMLRVIKAHQLLDPAYPPPPHMKISALSTREIPGAEQLFLPAGAEQDFQTVALARVQPGWVTIFGRPSDVAFLILARRVRPFSIGLVMGTPESPDESGVYRIAGPYSSCAIKDLDLVIPSSPELAIILRVYTFV